MSEKVIGYILLSVGILLILFTAFNIISVFTGSAKPVQMFNFEGIGVNTSDLDLDLVSPDLINQTSNLFAHIFLMGFISTVGFKLASLGTMLVRPIVVKVKEANAPQTPKQA